MYKDNFRGRDCFEDEVKKQIIDAGEFNPSYMWNVNGWLCAKLGLTVKRQTQKCVPQTYKEDIFSSTLDFRLKPAVSIKLYLTSFSQSSFNCSSPIFVSL